MEPHATRGCLLLCALLLPAALLCPVGEFGCGNLTQCVAQKRICDQTPDCPNGEDELNCTLLIPDNIIAPVIVEPLSEWIQPFNSCVMASCPAPCTCKGGTWLYCISANLTRVPAHVSPEATRLLLNNNSLTSLRQEDFDPYPNVVMLNLEGNLLERLEKNTFSSLRSLSMLFIKGNRLSVVEVGAFDGLTNLTWLTLQENRLVDLDPEVFANLPALYELDLRHNRLHMQGGLIFPPMPGLGWLLLEGNAIQVLEANTFSSLDFLKILNLADNRIWRVHEDAFNGLISLHELDLSYNQLRHLRPSFLEGLHNLTRLKLDYNPLNSLPHGLFSPVEHLTILSLLGIDITNMNVTLFSGLPRLQFAYFKKFHYCSFVPHVRVCRPNTDGVSSIENLLGFQIQRFSVWVVAILTCLGNAGVLCGRAVAREDNRVLSLFIRNLAAADLLMGVYLLVIAGHDLFYRDHFNMHARTWMASWRCAGAGALAMTSSEASMLILASMSLERFVCIASPYGGRRLSPGAAFLGLAAIWGTSLVLALFPALHWSQQTDNAFYGSNGLCFPLHIDEPFLVGWQYSIFVFVGVNGCGVLLISTAYVAMCSSIRRTRKATPLMIGDREFAFRFLFIVVTDCVCWIPIILLKLVALNRTAISASLYAWVVVFILPINSALNPFIYTFTTTKFRSRVRKVFTRQLLVQAWIAPSTRKDSADTESTSASSRRSLPKNGYHQVARVGQDCFHFVGLPEYGGPPPPYLGSIESCI